MSRIVAALEAANGLDDQIRVYCDFCTGSPISGHFEGCPIRATVAALKGEVAQPNEQEIGGIDRATSLT
jgi:hypothetical protein